MNVTQSGGANQQPAGSAGRAIVVGGGLAGLAAAADLLAAGFEVHLLEGQISLLPEMPPLIILLFQKDTVYPS